MARVLDGSPALDAGIWAGEEVETVDGRSAAEIGIPELRERFRREGQDVLRRESPRRRICGQTILCG